MILQTPLSPLVENQMSMLICMCLNDVLFVFHFIHFCVRDQYLCSSQELSILHTRLKITVCVAIVSLICQARWRKHNTIFWQITNFRFPMHFHARRCNVASGTDVVFCWYMRNLVSQHTREQLFCYYVYTCSQVCHFLCIWVMFINYPCSSPLVRPEVYYAFASWLRLASMLPTRPQWP